MTKGCAETKIDTQNRLRAEVHVRSCAHVIGPYGVISRVQGVPALNRNACNTPKYVALPFTHVLLIQLEDVLAQCVPPEDRVHPK